MSLYVILFLLSSSLFLLLIVDRIHDVFGIPSLTDSSLTIRPLVEEGLNFPTQMAFLGPDDILILEKNEGTVRRIINGVLLSEPVLQVPVFTEIERGMLGIAIDAQNETTKNVFLYYTYGNTSSNVVYKYDFVNNHLENPTLLLNLTALPGPVHNGGALKIGPDGNLYLSIGDVYRRTEAQNLNNGNKSVGTGGILRITKVGSYPNPILGEEYPLNLYYSYGIRNSYGIDFDPFTGKLWDSENGPEYGDEINLVEPGFNSGWMLAQGLWEPKWSATKGQGTYAGREFNMTNTLVNFSGRGVYSTPELTTKNFTIGPTAIKFFDSEKLGEKYYGDLFVGSAHQKGNVFHFPLHENRTGILLNDTLTDRVADSYEELSRYIFGQGFGTVTDIKIGPDGYLYIVSLSGQTVYQVLPKNSTTYGKSIDLLSARQNQVWQFQGSRDVSQQVNELNFLVNTSSSEKLYNRAFLNTELEPQGQYSSNPIALDISYSTRTDKPTTKFVLEVREAESDKIVWSAKLNNTNGDSTDDVIFAPKKILGSPIQVRIYAITEEPSLSYVNVSKFQLKY